MGGPTVDFDPQTPPKHALGGDRHTGSLNLPNRTIGTLERNRYTGSPPIAHAAGKVTEGTFDPARIPGAGSLGSLHVQDDTFGSLSVPDRTFGTLESERYAGSPPQLHSWGTAHRGTLPLSDTGGTLASHRYAGSVYGPSLVDLGGAAIGGGSLETDAVGTRPLDLGISPRWTGTHIFDHPIIVNDQQGSARAVFRGRDEGSLVSIDAAGNQVSIHGGNDPDYGALFVHGRDTGAGRLQDIITTLGEDEATVTLQSVNEGTVSLARLQTPSLTSNREVTPAVLAAFVFDDRPDQSDANVNPGTVVNTWWDEGTHRVEGILDARGSTLLSRVQRGTVPAARIQEGTLADARIPLLGDLRGSLDIASETFGSLDLASRSRGSLSLPNRTRGSLPLDTRASGTLPSVQIDDPLERTTFQGSLGSFFGTVLAGALTGRGVDPTMTVDADLFPASPIFDLGGTGDRWGEVFGHQFQGGTFTGDEGSFDMFRGSVPADQGARLYGTLPGNQYAGSQPQLHSWGTAHLGTLPVSDTQGTLGRKRTPAENVRRALSGTIQRGSVGDADDPFEVAWDKGGQLWTHFLNDGTIHRLGTEGFRGGTPSRFGTTTGGSFNLTGDWDETPVESLGFDERGHFWLAPEGSYWVELGTLGLRGAGSDNRIGTVLIGSFARFDSTRVHAIEPAPAGESGEIWLTESGVGTAYRVGTQPLRAGTDSRRGTQRIGSVNIHGPLGDSGLAKERYLWHGHADNTLQKIGTGPLRAGTDSRQGTRNLGTVGASVNVQQDLAIDPDMGLLWGARNELEALGTPEGRIRRDFDTPQLPPKNTNKRGKMVTITGSVNPGAADPSGFVITQRGVGTLAKEKAPGGLTAGGGRAASVWIDPQQGSYEVKLIGNAPTLQEWKEWHITGQ